MPLVEHVLQACAGLGTSTDHRRQKPRPGAARIPRARIRNGDTGPRKPAARRPRCWPESASWNRRSGTDLRRLFRQPADLVWQPGPPARGSGNDPGGGRPDDAAKSKIRVRAAASSGPNGKITAVREQSTLGPDEAAGGRSLLWGDGAAARLGAGCARSHPARSRHRGAVPDRTGRNGRNRRRGGRERAA